MSKRSILIAIALLTIIDIIAAFWYLALRLEREGGSHDLFERSHDSTALVSADTLDVVSVPDTFELSEYHSWFVARNGGERIASGKTVRLRWPMSVNGMNNLDELERALLQKALGGNAISRDEAVQRYLDVPHFNQQGLAYERVDSAPRVPAERCIEVATLVYPYLTSFQLLVMEIDHIESQGTIKRRSSSYVHYDRTTQRVLTRGDMLRYDSENSLLALINTKIDHLNAERTEPLRHATRLPHEMCCTRNGILFEFGEGDISNVGNGIIDVLLPWKSVRNYLTPAFAHLIDENDGYWRYKAL